MSSMGEADLEIISPTAMTSMALRHMLLIKSSKHSGQFLSYADNTLLLVGP